MGLESKFTVEIYQSDNGARPFVDWLHKIKDKKFAARLTSRLLRIEAGNFGDHKMLPDTGGVWELREHFGPGFRIYFAKQEDQIVLLLAGSDKSDQGRQIARAKMYLRDYNDRTN